MTRTLNVPQASTAHRRPGALVGAASLILGPALAGIGTLFRHETWPGTHPHYDLVDKYHDQNLLATQLTTLGLAVLIIAAFAVAWVARASGRVASAALVTSVFGLIALFGKAITNATAVAMAGVGDHKTLDALAENIVDETPLVLWLFPLYVVGSILLGVALWRSHAVPTWAAVLVGVGALAPLSVLTPVAVLSPVIAAVRIAGSIPVIRVLLTPVADD